MKLFFRFFIGIHTFFYRLTGGRFGSDMAGMKVLLLESIGRKSGKKRTTPVAYIPDGDNYVVTASNGGSPHHPGWYYNLRHQPQVTIQVKGEKIPVTAVQANPEQHSRLWAQLIKSAPNFEEYQKNTSREIAMFILRPTT